MNKKYLFFMLCFAHGQASAMKKNDALTPAEKAKKEQEFEARMHAMRIEQAMRAHASPDKEPKVTVAGAGSIDFGEEGIPVEEFVGVLRGIAAKKRAQNPTAKEELPPALVSTLVCAKLTKDYQEQGYRAYPQNDGIIGYCQPGRERELQALLAMHRASIK